MNKVFKFKLNENNKLCIEQSSGDIVNQKFIFEDNTITGEDLFTLFDAKIGDKFCVEDNPFCEKNNAKEYKQVETIKKLIEDIIVDLNKADDVGIQDNKYKMQDNEIDSIEEK